MTTTDSDGVAQQQIRAFVERILRLKEEQKSITDDIKEVYAEAKGNGFDKTVLGKLVNYVEKRAKSADTLAEQDALFALYLVAYDGVTSDDFEEENVRPSRTHAHAREDDPPHDEDGVILEDEPKATFSVAAEDIEHVTSRTYSADEIYARFSIPVSHTPEQPGRADPGSPDGAASAGETATVYPGGENANSVGNADASHASLRSGGAEAARLAHNQEVAGASPAPATISEVGTPATTEPDAALRPQMGGHKTLVDEPVTIPRAVVTEAAGRNSARPSAAVPASDRTKPHPWCADPEECGPSSWEYMCEACKRRHSQEVAAGAVH